MANKVYSVKQEQVARFAKAMGHPARIAILQFLAKQTQCYFGDIHEELPIAKATVSQHLKELKGLKGQSHTSLIINHLQNYHSFQLLFKEVNLRYFQAKPAIKSLQK